MAAQRLKDCHSIRDAPQLAAASLVPAPTVCPISHNKLAIERVERVGPLTVFLAVIALTRAQAGRFGRACF